jgi:hypothetical protein
VLSQEFSLKAVETLNAMAWKNMNKKFLNYLGEFRVITAPADIYDNILQCFRWYESGDLINPDSGSKYNKELGPNKTWERKYTVAYAFKCLRGLGPTSMTRLVDRISAGLTHRGLHRRNKDLAGIPKVYLGQPKPKSKFAYSLKEWSDRRKAKNAVVRFFNKRWASDIWEDGDVNFDRWRMFKLLVGFNSAHMDELLCRGTRKYLSNFLKTSDTPKREQEPPPQEFTAEILRVVEKAKTIDMKPHKMPPLSVYRTEGHLTRFVKSQAEEVPFGLKPEDETGVWSSVKTEDMQFQGGILDFRGLDEFMENDKVPVDPELGKCYLSILKPLLSPKNYIQSAPVWMVICHSLKSAEASKTMRKLLPEWCLLKSQYVPANCETYLLSPAATKKGNGVTIFILHSPKNTVLWPDLVRSAERYKKAGKVREYGIFDYELRMELYLDFMSKLPWKQDGENYVNCIAAGRKCMIAAYVSFHPLAQFIVSQWEIAHWDKVRLCKILTW